MINNKVIELEAIIFICRKWNQGNEDPIGGVYEGEKVYDLDLSNDGTRLAIGHAGYGENLE